MKQAIAFLRAPDGLDYGRRLSRLRWLRAVPDCHPAEISPDEPAAPQLAVSETWLIVREETALPIAFSRFPVPGPERVLVASSAGVGQASAHTLRELEALGRQCGDGRQEPASSGRVAAFSFRVSDFPPGSGESAGEFFDRLLGEGGVKEPAPGFRVFSFGDPSELERPEIIRHVPVECRRLLDVGCGAGGTAAALRRRSAALRVTAIEKDERSAVKAREVLDRVLSGDALANLAALDHEGAKFDAFLFADVLEHLEDPARALSLARPLAAPGAVLVASVPNAGHLSVVRDLMLGRFDPVPAGLADAGHLRWFTRTSLEDMLRETGWRMASIDSWPGSPAREAAEFLSHLSRWPGLDRESLGTYQWIAVAIAR